MSRTFKDLPLAVQDRRGQQIAERSQARRVATYGGQSSQAKRAGGGIRRGQAQR
jgi:hypothetical protein